MTNTQKFDIIETANPVLTVAPIEEETEMLGATDKITALYCRLSVEDMKEGKNGEKTDESNSIQTQKMILLQYAKQNHFPNPTFFVDASDIIGLKQNPTNGYRFSPIFSFSAI